MGVFDVPAPRLIEEIAQDLSKNQQVEQPVFTAFVKTGAHTERAPQRRDWYYLRMASVLYRVFKDGRTGVGTLRSYYGGRKNRGARPHRHVKAGGKIIRTALQKLEAIEFVKKEPNGRVIAPKGHAYLVRTATTLQKKLAQEAAQPKPRPKLKKLFTAPKEKSEKRGAKGKPTEKKEKHAKPKEKGAKKAKKGKKGKKSKKGKKGK